MRRFFTGLRARLFFLVALALVPSIGLLAYSAAGQRQHDVALAQSAALNIAQSVAAEHLQWVTDTRTLLRLLSDVPAIAGNDPRACQTVLDAALGEQDGYTSLTVVDAQGNQVCSTASAPAAGTTDKVWFQETLRTKGFSVGDYQMDTADHHSVVVFAYPVLDGNGKVQRVIAASMDLSWVNARMKEAPLPPGSTLTLLDSQGTVLAREPNDGQIGVNEANVPVVSYALSQTSDSVTSGLQGIDGRDRLYGVVPFEGSPNSPAFRVVVGIPQDWAYHAANAALLRNLLALGVVAILGLVAAWFLADHFVMRRLRGLMLAAERVGSGDFNARAGLPHDETEFGRVGIAFDQMAESLEEREKERELLEQQRIALERAQAEKESAEASQQRRAIQYAVSHILLDAASLQAAAPLLLREIGRGLGADAAAFWVLDGKSRNPKFRSSWRSNGFPLDEYVTKVPPTDGLAPRAAELGHHGAFVLDLAEGAAESRFALAHEHGMRWAIIIPLEIRRGASGLMEFLSRDLPQESNTMLMALTSAGSNFSRFIHRREAEAAREAEQARLRMLVETTPAAVVVVDAQSGRLVHANGEWERLAGVGRTRMATVEDFLGLAAWLRPDGAEYQQDDLPLTRAIATGESVLAEEIVLAFSDGRRVPTLTSAAPIKDDEGRVTSAVLVLQDISKLQEVERLRNEFLGMVTHELRTPLAIIKMTAEAALMDGLDRETAEAFHLVRGQVDRLLAMVGNLKDMAQIEAGAFSVSLKPARLEPVLIEAKRAIETTTSGIVNLEVPLELPPLELDSERLLQVLHNLLHNAVKFSAPGVPVRLHVERTGRTVTVSVHNSGPGIAKEHQKYLFRKFSQIQRRDGSGLGLAISKGIVEAHGGRIWVESDADAPETIFAFTLPVPAAAKVTAPEISVT